MLHLNKLVITVFSVFFAFSIYAQDSEVSSLSTSIEEIVVTARATEEAVRDIPVAISAYTEEDMDNFKLYLKKNVSSLTKTTIIVAIRSKKFEIWIIFLGPI